MTIPIQQYLPDASRLVLGCMNIGGGWNDNPVSKEDVNQASDIISCALENNINTIDLADIYTFGKAEKTLGELFKRERSLRHHLIIQSKIGIKLSHQFNISHYNLSDEWITESVNDSIKRLHDTNLDILFLHRPDPLMQLEDAANALSKLYEQGKFEYLAVSNMHAGQIAFLQSALKFPIIANQLEMSLLKHDFVTDNLTVNMSENAMNGFPRGTLEYCQQSNIQLQAWGALAQGKFSADHQYECTKLEKTRLLCQQLASEYDTNPNAIALAWLLKHPARIQPVIGSTNVSRLKDASDSLTVELSREHWYQLLEAIRGQPVP